MEKQTNIQHIYELLNNSVAVISSSEISHVIKKHSYESSLLAYLDLSLDIHSLQTVCTTVGRMHHYNQFSYNSYFIISYGRYIEQLIMIVYAIWIPFPVTCHPSEQD